MNNLEQLIEAANPNGNTLAEIYANIRDKALEEAAEVAEEIENDAYNDGRISSAIRALKSNP